MSLQVRDLVESLLRIEPSERLGSGDMAEHGAYLAIKQHPFFRGLQFDQLHQTSPPFTLHPSSSCDSPAGETSSDAHTTRPKTKRRRDKTPRDKTSQRQNVPRDKTSQGTKRPIDKTPQGTKRPKGHMSQGTKRSKGTNEAHYLTCVANYLIQYGQDKGMP